MFNDSKVYVIVCRHPGDNPFYSNIDSMPDIRPRRKSIPLVSELVSILFLNTHIRFLGFYFRSVFFFQSGIYVYMSIVFSSLFTK